MLQYYIQSKFATIFRTPDFICLYHPITLELFFINKKYLNIFKKIKERRNIEEFKNPEKSFLDILITKKFLIKNSNKDKILIKDLKKKLLKPNYSLLRILMADFCNLNCKYCKVKLNLKRKIAKVIREKDVRNVLKQFQKLSPRGGKLVSITGGEPLLYFDSVKKIIELCKEKLRNYWVVLFTNGTLLNENIISYLKKENILIVVSTDGRKSHDKIRIFKNGKGSYDLIEKGLNLLKQNRVRMGISCVVGKHNINTLYEDFKYIIDKFNPQSLGLNPLKYPSVRELNSNLLVDPKRYAREVYRLFKVARKKGIFVEQVNRKLLPFVERKFRFYECGACGGKNINIDAKGNIGPCKSYLVMKKLFQKSSEPISSKKVFKKLLKRAPLLIRACLKCPSIGICGGGCSYEAFVETRNISEFSKRGCSLTNEFLKLMILDLFILSKKIITRNLRKRGYYLIKDKERKKIYGRTRVLPGTLKYSVGHE